MLLELENISKHFQSPAENQPVQILDKISLTVKAGDSLAITGPSGSGKSTLLNIIGTLDKPSSGSLRLQGRDLLGRKPGELAKIRNREIGFIFQLHHLLPQCTVMENVLLPTLGADRKQNPAFSEERAWLLLKRVSLDKHIHYKPDQLSGGERQRVAVVRALINQPQLLLADEPTGSLDNLSADNLAGLLQELNREEKVTLVVVTHSLELAAKMNKVMVLHNGKLETSGK